jgi:hypothetical protein
MERDAKKLKCPRCASARLDERLGGQKYCKRCGQRWKANGLIVPSFDRRTLKGGEEEDKGGEQLPLVIL